MIAVIVAMKEELSGIINKEQINTAINNAYPNSKDNPYPYIIKDKNSIFVLTGMGKVNAASATQWIIDNFNITHIINYGTAGSLSKTTKPGSIIIPTECIQTDYDISAIKQDKGRIPYFEKLTPNKQLIQKTIDISNKHNTHTETGIISTTDTFVSDTNLSQQIHQQFNAISCDMEAGAIAQVSTRNNIPYIIIKKISDAADDNAHQDFQKLKQKGQDIANEARKIVEELITQI